MPLFGKKEKKIDLPEVVDFSNDTWSYKGNPPVYQIQSDGFTYDIVDSDGNDKNAISLGLAGMLVIVLNAKSPKIKEDELLPQFGKVIKTRNWHSMTVKEANFLVQTAIKKLTNSSTSGDVFDLASYAPLEVKRVLLKTLFTMSRMQLPSEFREEAEHRIIDDIVPDIFASPDYELALLTGLIVKAEDKSSEAVSSKIETTPIIENDLPYSFPAKEDSPEIPVAPSIPVAEPDSAFAELQKIYGRRIDSPQVRAAAQNMASVRAADPAQSADTANRGAESQSMNPFQNNQFNSNEPVSKNQVSIPNFSAPQPNNPFAANDPVSMNQVSAPNFSAPQPNNPFAANEPVSMNQVSAPNFSAPQPNNPFAANEPVSMNQVSAPNFSAPQPNNPFAANDPRNIPQPSAPNFSIPQPGNPFAANQGTIPPQQGIPQPPIPPNFQQQNMPYGAYGNQGITPVQQQGFQQQTPYGGNFQQYPGQMWQQNQPYQQPNMNMPNNIQQNIPNQGWQQNVQQPQNMQGFPPNLNPGQTPDGVNIPPQTYPGWQNRSQYPQQPQSPQNN